MISEYYLKYKGPNLTKATLNDVDITSIVQKFYGKNNNWQGRLWKYKDRNNIPNEVIEELKIV